MATMNRQTSKESSSNATGAAGAAGNVASNVGTAATSTLSNLGHRIEEYGDTLRTKAPDEGRIHDAAEAVAKRMENAGQYLQDTNVKSLAKDAGNFIKKHPIPSVMVGLGLGYLVARRRRRS